ncbi:MULTISPECIES: divalent-cation tolerance protein CutA [unclassified Vibrio]|uniref:Divalent-cation tolerance protein CutA n=1 Tax=Vibrio sp. HB236076 TaxID=3232307 RepID=A0AB39HH09_9VIBR|nr:divalent-cation tolerance protein CutA [Vibrio sp. HB161653]MDP5252993.1 divalent-cation tolerance protein CutA [Vibrio sp. HB161653]
MTKKYCVVMTTTSREGNAESIIRYLLDNKLAACVQTQTIQSHYLWEQEICHDSEILISIKTRLSLYPQVEQAILAVHEYQVPQIIQLPICDGFSPYLAWIRESTAGLQDQ